MIEFVVTARLDEGMREPLAQAPEEWWVPIPHSELECADLDHVSIWGAAPAQAHHQLRYVATGQILPGELGVGRNESPARDGPAYRWRVYLTNAPYPGTREDAGPPMMAPEVVCYAHERCGHGEEVHAVLKQDLAGGKMPSGSFGSNVPWWHLTTLTLNLNAVLRHCAFGRDWIWAHMKQVRLHWVHLVARVTRHARVEKLRFQPSRASRVLQALERMSNVLAHAPP